MQRKIKDYKKWMVVKARVNNYAPVRSIKEGEVWWAAIGENVGVEIDGKSDNYSRPVLIFKKHTGLCFTGIPLSSKLHKGSWYVSFVFKNNLENAVVVQASLMSTVRLYEKIGEVSKGDFARIQKGFENLFIKNVP